VRPPAQLPLPMELVRVDPAAIGDNPGGSIKDRMVLGELNDLITQGKLQRGDWVAEASSGSTARSLAYHCASLGLRCALFVPLTLPEPDLRRLSDSGAEVHPVEVEGAYERFGDFCRRRAVLPFNQLFDASKRRHYLAFGRAIADLVGPVDWLIGGVGTGHSLSGTGSGMSTAPLLFSAEPASGGVNGIRNIALERHGPEDPCAEAWFNRRVVIEKQDYFPHPLIRTDRGNMAFSDSFRVVLGAFRTAAEREPAADRPITVFLLGAQNRLDPAN
jgi:hypothetical protein